MAKKNLEKQTSKLSQGVLSANTGFGTAMTILGMPVATLAALGLAGISIPLIATVGLVGLFAVPGIIIGGAVGYSIYRNQVKPEKQMIKQIRTLEQNINEISIEGDIKSNDSLNSVIKLLDNPKTNVVELDKQLDDDNLLKGQLQGLKAATNKTDFISKLAKTSTQAKHNDTKPETNKLNATVGPTRSGLGFFTRTTAATTTIVTAGVAVAGLFIAGAALPATAIVGLTVATIGAAIGVGLTAGLLARKIFKRNKAKKDKIAKLTEQKQSLENVATTVNTLCKDAKLAMSKNELIAVKQDLVVANKRQVTHVKENKAQVHAELLANHSSLFAKPKAVNIKLHAVSAPQITNPLVQAAKSGSIPNLATEMDDSQSSTIAAQPKVITNNM